mmetsp:Transcript_13704/g.20600  ORF Transcript_13704/g.20600 Transcript_13704/m.20600 type:complete len:217 (+) Transcript_13704:27-677(+)
MPTATTRTIPALALAPAPAPAPNKNREDLKAALANLTSLVENEFKCPLCCDTYTDPHIIPECLHRFCGTCAKRHMQDNGGSCPTCSARLTIKRGLTRDKELQIMISMVLEAIQDMNIELKGKKCIATTETQLKIEQYSDSSVDEGGSPLLRVRVLVEETGPMPLLRAVDYLNESDGSSDEESDGSDEESDDESYSSESNVRVKTEDSNSDAGVKIE